MVEFLANYDCPRILEIGVDKGQTTFPVIHHLTMMNKRFVYDAVDVFVRDEVKVIASYFGLGAEQRLNLIQANSLNLLPQLTTKYHLILLDGDHNYHTVSQELEMLHRNNCLSDTAMVIDDYHGRWSEKDMYYSTREEYDTVPNTTKPVASEKQGVKPAVDEFLVRYPEWKPYILMKGEPVLLRRDIKEDF